MKEFATLIEAIAALLWPILVFVALFTFKKQIVHLIGRIKKGKLLGQEIELSESLAQLDKSALAVAKQVVSLPAKESGPPKSDAKEKDSVKDVLHEAARSPKAALILLASEIEREARHILASVGHLRGRRHVPFSQALGELDKQFGGLAGHVSGSIKHFGEARSKLVHGGEATTDDILRAIDSGVIILNALRAIPLELNVVYHPGVDIFEDHLCKNMLPNVKGVILETETPGGTRKFFRIFPTTHKHFRKGQRVAWEWNDQLVWGPAWYKDPDSGEIKNAWSSSMEFVGSNLNEV